MEVINLVCFNCKHFREFEGGCDAFPKGIPAEITSGENPHDKPLPNQKNNITFTPIKKDEKHRST